MQASHLQLNNFIAVAIVCVLLIGAAVAQTMEKDVKKDEKNVLKQENPKITSELEEKIASVKTEKELPVIIFFKKQEETGAAKALAQSGAISAVESKGGRVEHRYGLVDAISAKMPAGKIAELAASDDIERIYYDEIISLPPPQPLEPSLTNSTQTIGANYVWEMLGYTGTGIKVAVIDTGINYSHPDLGGGFGPGYRVIGGYDFYNEDSNPIDDDGHGTHVAGIIGANGSIKGVAPSVSFFAVKVCGIVGCPTSDIIAGIDWSVANGADIISMSLGGFSFPSDEFASPASIISDAAVDKGVVVVVAAGNEGPGTSTVSSPGSAKKVITVGASDSQGTVQIADDTIASFSSRGPSAFGRLDPEVVAPGVSINSTWYNGSYNTISGTSMATPHVSGAAAILLQKYSSLTPAEVRRILMQTAGNLTASNIHLFEKGAGIINVTKALTYNISATINGDDRWEESVLPGFTALAKLDLTNNNNYPVSFSFSLEGVTDLEGYNSLASSDFSLPDSVVVPAMTAITVDISFTAPINAKPAVYGGTLIVSNSTDGALRIPVVITIPLVGAGSIQGTVDDAGLSYPKGDWIGYKLRSYNGTTLKVYLNWTDTNDDLDLFIFAPNGVLVNYSVLTSGVSKVVTLNNTVYDEYWVAVHAWNLNGGESYYLNVSYPTGTRGNLEVSPASWQGVIASDETKNITFSITNDAIAKSNLNLSVKKLMAGGSNFSSGTIANTGSRYSPVWDFVSSGMNLNNTRYMNVTLRWINPANNLDLNLVYHNGTQWVDTRFTSEHDNQQLNQAWEGLENVDIQHYLKNYPNLGIGIKNTGGSKTYNLTINFTDIAPWSGASVNETSISLSSGQSKQINVTINGYSLNQNITDLVFSIQNSTEDYAAVPVRVNLLDITPPAVTANPTGYPSGYTAAKNGTAIILNASVSDNLGIKNVSTNASQINSSLGNVVLSYSNGFWTNSVIVNASDGIYNPNITAYDDAGNSDDTMQITVIVDNTPPIVSIHPVCYQHGSAANNLSIIGFNVSASDNPAGLKNASVNASSINNTGTIELSNYSGFWKANATFDNYTRDDNYSLSVIFFDYAGNFNDTQKINVSIDNTPPSVTDVNVSSRFINVTGSVNITADITSDDTRSEVNASEVFARITYPNGTSINYNMSGGGTFYRNFTDTVQYGRFDVTILANDTTGNTNSTQKTQFITTFMTINTTVVAEANNETVISAPFSNTTIRLFTNNTSIGSINITQSKVNLTSNELTNNPGIYVLINISDSIKDNLSYAVISVNYTDAEISSLVESSLRLYKWNTSSPVWERLSGAGSPWYVISAGVDTNNNFVWANITKLCEFGVSGDLYVPPAQYYPSGGGGGGGGGGTSGENYTNIEVKEKYDLHIFKDKVTSYRFTNRSNPVMFVNITGNINAGEINAAVEVLRNTSTLIKPQTPAQGIVYKNVNIWVGTTGFAVPKNIKIAAIKFKVLNTWLESNSIAASEIKMLRWDGSKWVTLDTTLKEKDSANSYFEAKTDTFSPFAITGLVHAVVVTETRTKPAETATAAAVPAKKGIPGFETTIAILVIALLAASLRNDRKRRVRKDIQYSTLKQKMD